MQKPDSLRKLRTARGYKQQAVAEYLGITQQSYSDIERNVTCLDLETAQKLAVWYDVPLTEIYYHESTLPLPAPDTEKELLLQLVIEKDKRIALLEKLLQQKQKKK
jgi:transcriptional regulator with XRE-family HTH domain